MAIGTIRAAPGLSEARADVAMFIMFSVSALLAAALASVVVRWVLRLLAQTRFRFRV
jgi:hypothetical protein